MEDFPAFDALGCHFLMKTFSEKPAVAPLASPRVTQRPMRRLGPRFKIIDSYLLRCLASSTVRGLLWFGGLLVMVAVITAARKASDQSLPLSSMIQLIYLQLPRVFLFSLPMGVLYGTTEAFTELSGNGELTAIFAAGASLRRLLQMPLCWGIALTLFSFFVQDALVPRAEVAKNQVVANSVMAALGNGKLIYQDPPPGQGSLRRIVQAQRFDPKTNTLTRPVVQIFDADQRLALQISAERGIWNRDTNRWKFMHGQLTIFPTQNANASSTRKHVDNANNSASMSSEFDELERNEAPAPGVLSGATKTLRQHMEHGDFEMTTFSQLWNYRAQLMEQGPDADQTSANHQKLLRVLTYGLHDKIATPLICLCLVLVGLPLGLRPQRAGAGFAVGSSMIVLLLYYSLWTWTSTAGVQGQGNPLVLAYIGPFVIALVGLALLWRKRL